MTRDQRQDDIHTWVADLFRAPFTLAPASADASFRRYFRVTFDDAARPNLIVMDAPPDREDCRPFLAVGALFAQAGVNVPPVIERDLARGFLLLGDLGTTTYLSALQTPSAVDGLYSDAIDALIKIQLATKPDVLPPYDRALLERELMLFPEWYVGRQHAIELSATSRERLGEAFARILANNLEQPKVFVHRDYHSRNLMVTTPNPGILDFQDAVLGPITYDLASLLRDAYIEWEEAQVLDWCIRYWERARRASLPVPEAFGDFYRDFEWMGAQRQLKVLGIFARLCHRDGKARYLNDQPLVMRYLRRTCQRYSALGGLLRVLDEIEGRPVPTGGYTF